MDIKEWARFQELILKYQLNAVRAFLHEAGEEVKKRLAKKVRRR